MLNLNFQKIFLLISFIVISSFSFVTTSGNQIFVGSETNGDCIVVDPINDIVVLSVGVQINEGIVVMTDKYETFNFYVKKVKYLDGTYVYQIKKGDKFISLLKRYYKLMVTFPKKTGGVAAMTFNCTGFTKAYNKIRD